MHAGGRRAAAAIYERAAGESGDDPTLLAQVHEGLAWCLFLTREDMPGAAQHARRAVELAERIRDEVLLGDALSVQARRRARAVHGRRRPDLLRPQRGAHLPAQAYRLHCLGYGEVTRPAVRRMQVYGPRRIAMPVAPMPGPGESAQRQPCGRAGTAPSTRGAANAVVRGACAGLANCDDPANYDNTEPRLRVALNRVHDIDRPFFLSVTSNEPGDFRGLGSYGWSSRGGVRFRLDAVLRANVTTRIRIPIGAKAKRMIRRAARRGVETRGGYRAVGRDDACYPNRSHSSRFFTLVP